MNIYYMNENLTENKTIIGVNNMRSEYAELVEEYLARGGKITVCPPGQYARDAGLDNIEFDNNKER